MTNLFKKIYDIITIIIIIIIIIYKFPSKPMKIEKYSFFGNFVTERPPPERKILLLIQRRTPSFFVFFYLSNAPYIENRVSNPRLFYTVMPRENDDKALHQGSINKDLCLHLLWSKGMIDLWL